MKTIFITGGSTGIGAASIDKFIKEGWNVGFMDINVSAAEEIQQRINKPECLIFTVGSICNRTDIHNAIEATVSKFGKLDSVFANAGIHRKNTLLTITD